MLSGQALVRLSYRGWKPFLQITEIPEKRLRDVILATEGTESTELKNELKINKIDVFSLLFSVSSVA